MSDSHLEVRVDGKKVPTNDFIRRVFAGVVEALVVPLKGVEDPREIVITLRKT